MATQTPSPESPPRPSTKEGRIRRVGVEIEYANVDEPAAAALVQHSFGGQVRWQSGHRLRVDDTARGTFVVELDTQYAHPPENGDGTAEEPWAETARHILGDAISGIVPFEIVCPPIPWNELGELNPLFDGLRRLGAQGTQESAIFGFGLHLNIEIAEDSVEDILRQFQAYLLMSDWLRQEIVIDMTRRILPHASRFPEEYMMLVMAADYRPDLEEFIETYSAFNPSRNRELDLYPLFAFLKPNLVAELIDDPRIKPRPAFHYRLPNASLSQPGWYAVTEWNRWVEVERLAADREKLERLARAFNEHGEYPYRESWLDRLGRFLEE